MPLSRGDASFNVNVYGAVPPLMTGAVESWATPGRAWVRASSIVGLASTGASVSAENSATPNLVATADGVRRMRNENRSDLRQPVSVAATRG